MIIRIFSRFLRTFLIALAFASAWLTTEARAGCGTLVTINPTQYWAWVTIYDLGHLIHLDYGRLAPHSVRTWTGGAAGLPYACGSYYHVRFEVKSNTGPYWVEGDNIADTQMQVNPQLTLLDAVSLLHSIGTAITCITPGAEGGCIAEWGIHEGAQTAFFGAVGSDSTGSVVCLKGNAPWNFWIEGSSDCLKKPGRWVDKWELLPANFRVGVGTNTKFYVLKVLVNGKLVDEKTMKKGRLYTDHPGIAGFKDEHKGQFWGYKGGKTQAHFELDGKVKASSSIEIVQTH